MTTNSFFKIDSQARINELRVLADSLKTQELLALIAMTGLRNIQEANIDVINSGDAGPDELSNSVDDLSFCATEMMMDIINDVDIKESMSVNNLAEHYILDVRPVYKIIKK